MMLRPFTALLLFTSPLLSQPSFATTMSPAGNQEAARLFENYQQAPAVCDATLPGRRVLLTGFGLFMGVPFNSGGGIVTAIADPAVWPKSFEAGARVKLKAGASLQNGVFATNQGAKAFSRALTVSGEKLNLCVLVLDVLWDVAGAIVSYEMNRFQPHAVLMLGGGGGPILEGGALNETSPYIGYYADGSDASANFPLVKTNLPGKPYTHELPMLWDNTALVASLSPLLADIGETITPAPAARASNTYLCNQTSYIALASAGNQQIELAGGLIQLSPRIESNPQVGFFHLPWNLPFSADTYERWGSVVASLVAYMAKSP